MDERVLQCCYTNLEGGGSPSGWGAVACSEGIPSDAYEDCMRFLAGNSSIRGRMAGEGGDGLSLLEIAGGGRYLYVMRTRFGLTDAVGRRNVFSHAYLIPCTESLWRDPNQFLGIRADAFATSVGEAIVRRDALARGEGLPRGPRLDARSAIEGAGIRSREDLANLVCAVYDRLGAGAFGPLYVRCGGERQMLATLYCIYTFLPVHLRRRLVCASAEGSNVARAGVVFCREATGRRPCFDAAAGSGGALTVDRRKKIGRLGFVDYAALLGWEDAEEARRYLENLESAAVGLNAATDTQPQVVLLYKVAHRLVTRQEAVCDEGQLESMLDDALRLRSRGSESLDRHVAEIVREYVRRGLRIEAQVGDDLREWLRKPRSGDVARAFAEYEGRALLSSPPEEAAKALARMEADDPASFGGRCEGLAETEGGGKVLDAYYSGEFLSSRPVTWGLLEEALDGTKPIAGARQLTEAAVEERAWDLYLSRVEGGPAEAAEALGRYVQLAGPMDPAGSGAAEARAKAEFWRRVDTGRVAIGLADAYRAMDDGGGTARDVLDVLDVCGPLADGDEPGFLRRFHERCRRMPFVVPNIQDEERDSEFVRRVVGAYGTGDELLADWLGLVARAGEESTFEGIVRIRSLLRRSIPVGEGYAELCDAMSDYFNGLQDETYAAQLRRESLALVTEACKEADASGEGPVPLDVWLTLGSIRFGEDIAGGPFLIFDLVPEARVLACDPVSVVESSGLMRHQRYLTYAGLYASHREGKRKGMSAAEVVKGYIMIRKDDITREKLYTKKCIIMKKSKSA